MRKPKNFRERIHNTKFYEDAVEWQLTVTPDDDHAYIIPTDVYLPQFSSVILIDLPWLTSKPDEYIHVKYCEKGKGDNWHAGEKWFFQPTDFATPDRFIAWIRSIVRNSYGYVKKQNP